MKKERIGFIILILFALTAIIGIIFSPPILQDENYHHFSDNCNIAGIPNCWNVISNIPFLIVGLIGLYKTEHDKASRFQYISFFGSMVFVAFGSAFYHYEPNAKTLILDRLPMTIAFMSLLSMIISECIDAKTGRSLLIPFMIIGIVSILYWIIFNDLRFYALVQFYPMLAIPVILICFRKDGHSAKAYWLLLLAYIIAKLFEHFDTEIHQAFKFISGHSLKHIVAAIGVYQLVRAMESQIENKKIVSSLKPDQH